MSKTTCGVRKMGKRLLALKRVWSFHKERGASAHTHVHTPAHTHAQQNIITRAHQNARTYTKIHSRAHTKMHARTKIHACAHTKMDARTLKYTHSRTPKRTHAPVCWRRPRGRSRRAPCFPWVWPEVRRGFPSFRPAASPAERPLACSWAAGSAESNTGGIKETKYWQKLLTIDSTPHKNGLFARQVLWVIYLRPGIN